MSWDDAINEIGDKMLDIRGKSGPDSVYWLGSAKSNNEQAYLFRKLYAYWGSNNGDHQARFVTLLQLRVLLTPGAMALVTNSYNDIHNSRAILLLGVILLRRILCRCCTL